MKRYTNFPIVIVDGKRPIFLNWPNRQPSLEELESAKLQLPNFGIGVRLGQETGYADIECDNAEALNTWNSLNATSSVCWQSARGPHHLYKFLPGDFGDINRKIHGIEIRAEQGMQSVLPPYGGRIWIGDSEEVFLAGGTPYITNVLLSNLHNLSTPAKSSQILPEESPLDRPGDLYNVMGDWRELLEPRGWVFCGQEGEVIYVRRPGKTEGISGTIGFCSTTRRPNCLFVFSTADEIAPFEPQRAYTLFEAYALLEHGNNFPAAAAALAREGYKSVVAPVEIFENLPISEVSGDKITGVTEYRELSASADDWPQLDESCYDNPIGEYALALSRVGLVESDPAAIYLQALTIFGATLGRGVWIPTEAGVIYPNDFLVLVGESFSGRKGTSWNHAKRLFNRTTDNIEFDDKVESITARYYQIITGRFDSGEGVSAVFRNKDQKCGEEVSILSHDSEISGGFKKAQIEKSTLDDAFIKIWDGTSLSSARSKDQIYVKSPVGSIVGHVQPDILTSCLTKELLYSGLLNRFQFLYTKRIRKNRDAEGLLDYEIEPFRKKVENSWRWSKVNQGEISETTKAKTLLDTIYHTTEFEGLKGLMFQRFIVHIKKLALKLAVLRQDKKLEESDVKIAIEIQNVIMNHTERLLGGWRDGGNNDDVSKLQQFIFDTPNGVTRTDISTKLFSNHKKSTETKIMLDKLLVDKRIKVTKRGKVDVFIRT